MNRIRIAALITAIVAVIAAGSGLMVSLTQFGIWLAVAAAAVIAYGAVDFIESHRAEQAARYRAEVWHRRDREARQRQRIRSLYESPRDGIDR